MAEIVKESAATAKGAALDLMIQTSDFSFHISTDSKIIGVAFIGASLAALYFDSDAKQIRDAMDRAFGGGRDDRDVDEPGEDYKSFREDYKSGKIKKDLKEELFKEGIEVEELWIKIDDEKEAKEHRNKLKIKTPHDKKQVQIKQNALQFAKDRGDKIQETQANIELGKAYLDVRQEQNAIKCYQNAKEIAKERGDKCQEGKAYLGIGHAYRGVGQFQTAIENYQKVQKIARQRGDKCQEGQAYIGIGLVYRGVGQHQTAIENYQKVQEIARERGDKYQGGEAYLGIADPNDQDTIVTERPRRSNETETEVLPQIADDWFESTMLNGDDFYLKDEHEDFLISLKWIRSFGITGKNDKFSSAHLVITTEPDAKPSIKMLQEKFGDEIKDFILSKERNP